MQEDDLHLNSIRGKHKKLKYDGRPSRYSSNGKDVATERGRNFKNTLAPFKGGILKRITSTADVKYFNNNELVMFMQLFSFGNSKQCIS
ncbi:hypothetical protein V1478_001957 [Vespula squamosa]|uniref:Uncharacterized protein n=1 Tax=Vespula squamosa TaxID=30214 RepID=A0ABD2BYL4_VESSQ